jgi:hypothetical protein
MNRQDYFEQYSWILKVLSSCENEEQVKTTEKLFELYMKKWNKETNINFVSTFESNFDKEKKIKSLSLGKNRKSFLCKFSQFFTL